MADRDNSPELEAQGYDTSPPVNLGHELLKGIGLLAAYHFGSLAIEKATAVAGRAVTRSLAEYGPGLAARIRVASAKGFAGSLGEAVGREARAGIGAARREVRAATAA